MHFLDIVVPSVVFITTNTVNSRLDTKEKVGDSFASGICRLLTSFRFSAIYIVVYSLKYLNCLLYIFLSFSLE